MSDTSAQIAFVQKEPIPESPPPSTAAGPIKWMRDNLFSGWVNSILTLAGTFGWSARSVLAGLLGVSIAGVAFMLSIATLTGYVLTNWIP